jgi:hypothetical protein
LKEEIEDFLDQEERCVIAVVGREARNSSVGGGGGGIGGSGGSGGSSDGGIFFRREEDRRRVGSGLLGGSSFTCAGGDSRIDVQDSGAIIGRELERFKAA